MAYNSDSDPGARGGRAIAALVAVAVGIAVVLAMKWYWALLLLLPSAAFNVYQIGHFFRHRDD